MRFLLIRFSSLGDIVLQTSFASWLKSQFPDSSVDFLTLKGNEALIQGHPHINEVLTYQKRKGLSDIKSLFSYARKLSGKYDLIVDLHGTNRSFLTKCFLFGTPALSMDKRRLERFLLVKAKLDLLKNQPSLHERNLKDLAWAFGRSYNKEDLLSFLQKSFPGNKSLITSSVTNAASKNKRLVVLAPGASFKAKRWPVENFFQLASLILEKTELECVVVGGPQDEFCKVFDELATKYPERMRNLQGKMGLGDSMLAVAQAALLIGNDSLMAHVAESCSIPAFSVFGPTSESFGFAPHLPESRSFSVDGLWCRPCSTTGSRDCFRKEQYCMKGVEPVRVFDAVASFFKGARDAV